jgi:hypothetical protein
MVAASSCWSEAGSFLAREQCTTGIAPVVVYLATFCSSSVAAPIGYPTFFQNGVTSSSKSYELALLQPDY